MSDNEFIAALRCPHCACQGGGKLISERETWLVCQEVDCGRKYPIRNGVPMVLTDEGDKWINIDLQDLPQDALPALSNQPDPAWLGRKAQELRISILRMVINAGSGHIGGAYSVLEIMTALYFGILKHDPRNPAWDGRDRLIFSKGHACLALYVCLAEQGYFPKARLDEFLVDDGLLGGHPERGHIPGVEVTAGSLGHGLPMAIGMAMALKKTGLGQRVFAVLSDGECNEGSVWEAFLSAAQFKLDGLTAIIDNNHMESLAPTDDILKLEPMADKLRAFGWAVQEVDGHNMEQVVSALEAVPMERGKPNAIVAHTIKGKGVSFMENVPMWHLRGPTPEEAKTAYSELARAINS